MFEYLNNIDISVLSSVVQQKLSEQCLLESFESFVDVLYKNEWLFQDILLHHFLRFSQLYNRIQWLDFCDNNSVPVSESNVVMMTISSAIYELLLE